MGSGSTDNSLISRMCWTLALWLSSGLEQDEREAIIGDLAEFRESNQRALANVLGLVVRRQASVWQTSHLWVVLFIFVIPFSFLLCTEAQNAAGLGAVYTWMYANNWDWELTKNAGFWYELGHAAIQLSKGYLMVACWSWSAGFLLGCVRKAVQPTTRVALLLLLTIFHLAHAPQHWFHFWLDLSGVPPMPSLDPNAPVTALVFYRLVFPLLVLGLLVILPAISGMRQQVSRAPQKLRFILVFAAAVSVMTLLFRVPPGLGLLLGASGRQWVWQHRDAMGLLPLLAYWPVLYMVVVGLRRFRGRKTALA